MQGGIVIMMKGAWYKVPSKLFNDEGITKADMAVYAYTADRLKGKEGAVSVRAVAAATELSTRQVQASLRKLCERHYLHREERAGRASIYWDLLLPIRKGDDLNEHTLEPCIQAYFKNRHEA